MPFNNNNNNNNNTNNPHLPAFKGTLLGMQSDKVQY